MDVFGGILANLMQHDEDLRVHALWASESYESLCGQICGSAPDSLGPIRHPRSSVSILVAALPRCGCIN
jgi:hypothetical protein